MSTVPYAFIARGYCPGCRHELTGLPYALHVRCPECGAATEIGDLPLIPPPGPLARFFAFPQGPHRRATWIMALGFALIVMAAILLPSFAPIRCGDARTIKAATQLSLLHRSLQVFAEDSNGLYPVHAAALLPDNYLDPRYLLDSRAASTNSVAVGDVDLLLYDWSPEATTVLDAEIASCDVSAPYYRIGDFWLVRPPKPTCSQALIAGWCDVVADGERWVVFDDNQVKAIDRDGWGRIWRTDAGERARLGRPRVQTPQWGGDGG